MAVFEMRNARKAFGALEVLKGVGRRQVDDAALRDAA